MSKWHEWAPTLLIFVFISKLRGHHMCGGIVQISHASVSVLRTFYCSIECPLREVWNDYIQFASKLLKYGWDVSDIISISLHFCFEWIFQSALRCFPSFTWSQSLNPIKRFNFLNKTNLLTAIILYVNKYATTINPYLFKARFSILWI